MGLESTTLSYRQTGKFSALFCDYTENQASLLPFHSGFPMKENFRKAIAEKKGNFKPEIRQLIAKILGVQTRSAAFHPKQIQNLELLQTSDCFTVSCGHQLCIGGGPQYMLFKILSTIRMAEELAQISPEQTFVPVFWMAGEDHDLEEILHLRFFGKDYRIHLEGDGAVGRLKTDGIAEQLRSIPDFPESMAKAYAESSTLSEATRKWLHQYFGHLGLLVLDADDADLKSAFLPEMLSELESDAIFQKVDEQSRKLDKLGFETQLHPRSINLFLLDKPNRLRMERSPDGLKTIDGTFEKSLSEAKEWFTDNPDQLSPNACLRPMYSQKILPDIAFIGGPAEIAYWLQLKTAFEHLNISFPMLIPRFSALLLPESRVARLHKLGLKPEDLFKNEAQLRRKIALGEAEIPQPNLRESFEKLLKLAGHQDPGTLASLEADLVRMEAMAENMQKKLRKAMEKKAETQINQLEGMLTFAFPGGGLLERKESWLSLLTQNPALMDDLLQIIQPQRQEFQIVTV